MICCCRKARSACWRCWKPGASRSGKNLRKWELDFAVIGITTDTHRFSPGTSEIVADISVTSLSDEAPVYSAPCQRAPLPTNLAMTRQALALADDNLGTPDMAFAAGSGNSMTQRDE